MRSVKYDNNEFTTKFGGKPHSYIVDHNFIVYDAKSKMPTSAYYVNNPNPIRLQHERNEELDSISFKRILDDKTVSDLFSPEGKNMLMILTMMVGACIALIIIVIAIQSGWITLSAAHAATTAVPK